MLKTVTCDGFRFLILVYPNKEITDLKLELLELVACVITALKVKVICDCDKHWIRLL